MRQSVAREESISPAVQEQAGREYCARQGYVVAQVISDVGKSGLSWEKRPGVQQVMKLISEQHAEVVVVWRWSRLSRRRLHQAVALDAIERAGGVVESATEPFDTSTAGGQFGRDVMLAAAAFESQQKAEQWADAHRRRREAGLPASGGARLGYLLLDRQYVPDPDVAPIVVELFARYIGGAGLEVLADWLHSVGVMSPRQKAAARWTKRGIAYAMDSGFAAGLLHVGGEHPAGAHPGIITELVWKSYQLERQRRATTAPRLLHPKTKLAGLVRCAACHRSMTTKTHNGIAAGWLRCTNRECPASAFVARSKVEAAVLAWLPQVAEIVEARAKLLPSAAVVKQDRRLHARRASDAKVALKRLILEMSRSDAMPRQMYDEARAELVAEFETAEVELAKLDARATVSTGAVVAAAGLLDLWQHGEPLAVNTVARQLLWVSVDRLAGQAIVVHAAWD